MFCGGEYETTGMGKGDRAIRGRNGIRPNEQILVGSRARTGERKGSYSASLVALLPYILTFQQNTQNDGSVKGTRYFECSPKKVRSVRARSARIPIIPVVITQITRISLVSLIHIIRKSLEYQRSNLFTLECYES